MIDVIEFSVPLPHRALRTNSLTGHTGYKARLKRAYQEEVWCAGNVATTVNMWGNRTGFAHPEAWEKAIVTYLWHSTHPTDEDNIIHSMKPALDVLKATGPRPLGIIRDDGPGVTVRAEWVKESKRSQCRVEIVIERIEDQEFEPHKHGEIEHLHFYRPSEEHDHR